MTHSTTNCVWCIIFLKVICLRNEIRNLINLLSFGIKTIHHFWLPSDTFSFAMARWRWIIWNHHTFSKIHVWHRSVYQTVSIFMSSRTSSWCWLFLFWWIHRLIGNIKFYPLRLTVSFLWFLHKIAFFILNLKNLIVL